MNHWNLFKESWRIFWRNPALWLFGLLAALGGGFNLRYNFNFNFNPGNFDPGLFDRYFNLYGPRLSEMPSEFRTLFSQIFSSPLFGVIAIVGIVWAIIAFLLVTYADGALAGSGSRMYADAAKFVFVAPPPAAPVIASQPEDAAVPQGSNGSGPKRVQVPGAPGRTAGGIDARRGDSLR